MVGIYPPLFVLQHLDAVWAVALNAEFRFATLGAIDDIALVYKANRARFRAFDLENYARMEPHRLADDSDLIFGLAPEAESAGIAPSKVRYEDIGVLESAEESPFCCVEIVRGKRRYEHDVRPDRLELDLIGKKRQADRA